MRHLLLASVALAALSGGAFAADVRGFAPAAAYSPVPAAHDWAGFYAGVFGGLAASSHEVSSGPTTALGWNGSGGLAGAQIGYDYNLNDVVLGIYGDLAWANIGTTINLGSNSSLTDNVDYFGTIQGKVGVPVWDNALLYLHGGYAYAHETANLGGPSTIGENRNGIVIGVGAEYALNANLSVNTEYGYYHFADTPILSSGGSTVSEQTTFNAIKVGLNYRF